MMTQMRRCLTPEPALPGGRWFETRAPPALSFAGPGVP